MIAPPTRMVALSPPTVALEQLIHKVVQVNRQYDSHRSITHPRYFRFVAVMAKNVVGGNAADGCHTDDSTCHLVN